MKFFLAGAGNESNPSQEFMFKQQSGGRIALSLPSIFHQIGLGAVRLVDG